MDVVRMASTEALRAHDDPAHERRRFLGAAGAFAALAGLPVATRAADNDTPPVARRVQASDDYYGTTVQDPYRWMEDVKDPDLLPWLKGQDAYARSVLATVRGRDALRARVSALSGDLSITRKVEAAGGRLFYEQQPAGEQNFKLFVREGETRRTLIDPTKLQADGQHVSLDWWNPDPQGRFVVYGLSPGGSEASTAQVMEVATGRVLDERIPDTDWGITGWLADGSGFFYIQFTGERGTPNLYWDSVVKLHKLDTDAGTDAVFLQRGLHAQIPMEKTQAGVILPVPGSEQAIVMVVDVRPERAVWTVKVADLLARKPGFRLVATLDDLVVSVAASGDDLFLLSNKNRPRGRVLATSLARPSLAKAAEVLPQSNVVAEHLFPVRGGALVRTMDGGVQGLLRVSRSGKAAAVKLPFIGSVRDVFSTASSGEVHVALAGWLQPPAVWHMAPSLLMHKTDLDGTPPFDLSPYVAERRFARARDGVRIPFTIVARRGWRADAKNPVLAVAYGAYQYAISPSFQPRLLAFLDAGGIYVVAHVRGGGEYGRAWHKAGQKATKPNTWRDFIDVCQTLITSRVTSSKQLVIQGTSAGGIAVGRALTERPDLFAGAVSDVGWLNPMRYMAEQNNADIDEWGPIVDAASFRIMYAMDSYHAVKDAADYPPVLVISGYNDPRVATFHAAKFTARLQAANGSKSPTLLRIDFDSGHGMGSTREQRDALLADIYAFALWCAGTPAFQPMTTK